MDNRPQIRLTCACLTCRVKHESVALPETWLSHVDEFKQKHLRPECFVEFHSESRIIPKGWSHTPEARIYDARGEAPWWLDHAEFTPNANINIAYAASAAFTYTSLNSLASDNNLLAGASSLAVNNTSNLYLDYLVSGFAKNNASVAPTAGREIDVYLYNAFDDTPTYPDTIAGTDATKTITTANILASALAPFGSAVVAATTNQVNVFRGKSVAAAFGGILPSYFGLFIVHNSAQALNASGNTWSYKAAYMTAV